MAEELKRKKEAQFEGKPTTPENEQQTIEAAIQRFLDSKRVQGIDAQVVKKYERELEAGRTGSMLWSLRPGKRKKQPRNRNRPDAPFLLANGAFTPVRAGHQRWVIPPRYA